MSDEHRQAEAKLRKLGQRVRQGWAKLYPVSEQQLAKVRAAVRQQWEQTHAGQGKSKEQEAGHPAHGTKAHSSQHTHRNKSRRQEKSPSRDHDQGHDHGQSH